MISVTNFRNDATIGWFCIHIGEYKSMLSFVLFILCNQLFLKECFIIVHILNAVVFLKLLNIAMKLKF